MNFISMDSGLPLWWEILHHHQPATGEKLAECAEATKEDVDAAVQAAWAAFPAWRDLEPDKRAAILLKIADIIDENKELLATIESMDNGKPIRETMTIDVPYSSDHFRYFAGAIRTEEGSASILKDHVGEFMNIILHEPIGVVGQIVPLELPLPDGRLEAGPRPGGRRLHRL